MRDDPTIPPEPPDPSGFTRMTAVYVLLGGVGFIVINIVMAITGHFMPRMLGLAPILFGWSFVGLIDPRIFDALYSKPGTPWWAYVAALMVFVVGLAAGLGLVLLFAGHL
jgi:hypothetical protein